MFEALESQDVSALTDTALTDALHAATRDEAAAAAHRLALIAEVWTRHCDDDDEISAHQVIDGWETATAVVSAACNLSRHRASTQLSIARALRERLPKVAAVFARGDISATVAATITWRTKNITDPEAIALVDAALAGTATSYGALSTEKAEQAIDRWVEKFDPDAVCRVRRAARNRDIHFGAADDAAGTTDLWGRLLSTDAALVKQALMHLAGTVCDADPRTTGQRLADAMGALALRHDRLACLCGDPDCPAATTEPTTNNVVIYLLTDRLPTSSDNSDGGDGPTDGPTEGPDNGPDGGPDDGGRPDDGPHSEPLGGNTTETDCSGNTNDNTDTGHHADADTNDTATPPSDDRDGQADADRDGDAQAGDTPESDTAEHHADTADQPNADENDGAAPESADDTATATTPTADTTTPRDPRLHGDPDYHADILPAVTGSPAVILGGGIVPAPLLAELIAGGATITPVTATDLLGTENHYRPSTKLAAYIRLRDMRCMFPGCNTAAHYCDLDHTMPWPYGATHPGNLGAKCRTHHLIKTFPAADGGWTDVQHPDGSHTWTAPTGHTYRTTPYSHILFPQWNTHTPAPPPTGPPPEPTAHRDIKMPLRKRTRKQTRTQRINTQRRLNHQDNEPPF